MPTQPAHDRLDVRPFWRVQTVFDPDGGGKDFAYTMGLHARGFPELHLWGRPTHGDDPGEDWLFSSRDRAMLLNEFAAMLVRGDLDVGTVLEREYDGGLATVEFRVDPPGDREELEALGTVPDALVLPIRWSLRRAPEGPRTGLAPDDLVWAEQEWQRLTAGLARGRSAPAGWALPAKPTFAADLDFGPLTPLVRARAAQFLQADPATLAEFLEAALKVDRGMSLSFPISHARAVARPVGRSAQVEAVLDQTGGLVERITSGRRWRETLRIALDETGPPLHPDERARGARNVATLLGDAVRMCLAVQAVADVAPDDLRLHGFGAWEAARGGVRGRMPEGWHASLSVVDRVRTLLQGVRASTLRLVAFKHDTALRFASGDGWLADYHRVECRLTGWALASAAACPPVLGLLTAEQRAELAEDDGLWEGFDAEPLQEWATCLTSALTHRGRLAAEDVRVFAHPFPEVVGLERLLNTPV